MAKPIKDQLTKTNLGKRFFLFLLLLASCCLYSQQTTTWTPINLNTWESLSSDGLIRVECRVTGSVLISGNETMGCTSDNTYNNPTPDVFGSPSLEISVASLLTGTLEFHFFDATTGNPVYLTNPFVNVDKVGTYGILPFPLLNGTNTGVFTLTNETWTNISSNGPIFQSNNTQFQIDAGALLSSNGGECGNGVDEGTGGGTMRMDAPVQSIEMDASVSGSLISFNENVEFVLSNLIIAEPSIEVTKTVTENYSTPVSIGDIVNYTIQVENTGNVEIINIELTDSFTDANGNPLTLTSAPSFISATMGSGEGTLQANEIATYAAGYSFNGNAIDAGGVINQVTATGDSPYGPDDTFDTSDDGNDSDGNLLDDLTESFFPVPQDDTATVEEDDSVNILVTTNDDFGGNGPNTGSIILVSTPTNGAIELDNNSTPTNPVDDYFTYTPNTDYFGSDSFVYGIFDSKGHTQYATVTITIFACPDAGTNGTLNICQGDTFDNNDLFAQLGGSPDAGGNWTDNGDGTHTYTVLATAPCITDDSSTVTVVEQAPPNAGSDGTLNICQGDTFDNNDLFAQLGGSPDAGGTWTDNGDGTHTYTVLATAPCTTDDSSTVTVSINQTDLNNNGIADCTETIPVQLIINIDSITADNIINEQESLETITITGNVSGDFNQGDIVTLSINNTNYTGAVDSNGNFNISVSVNDLVSDIDTSVLGTITTINNNGNTGSASVQHPYTIDMEAPLVESFTTTDTFPILLGSGSPNEILTITVTVDNFGTPITYNINTDINGIWAIDTSTEVPQNGSFPTIDPEAILSITATDIAGNTGIGEVIIIFENEPLTADSDNDGLPDDEEVRIGTDPNNPDTDGDGVMDGQEVSDGTDPLDPCDSVGGTPPSGSTCELYVELDIVKPGDNINGNFEIINIERFPNNSVQIYNRWGVKVWETKGYENNTNAFNGISNGRTTIMQNEELPSGVYYYDIQYEARGEQKLLTGYLYVIR